MRQLIVAFLLLSFGFVLCEGHAAEKQGYRPRRKVKGLVEWESVFPARIQALESDPRPSASYALALGYFGLWMQEIPNDIAFFGQEKTKQFRKPISDVKAVDALVRCLESSRPNQPPKEKRAVEAALRLLSSVVLGKPIEVDVEQETQFALIETSFTVATPVPARALTLLLTARVRGFELSNLEVEACAAIVHNASDEEFEAAVLTIQPNQVQLPAYVPLSSASGR